MEQLKQLQNELGKISKHNPMYTIKVSALLEHTETLVNSGKLNTTCVDVIRNNYQIEECSTLGAYRVYKNAVSSNFTLKDFELTQLLGLREKLYDILKRIKTQDSSCDENLLALLEKLEYSMNNKEESFWDSFFLLLTLLRTNYYSDVFNDNRVNILKFIKYAAEEEGKMFDTLTDGKMELFANLLPSVGKENAILFHLTRTKFVDASNLFDVVRGVIDGDATFIKQTPKLTMLLENYAKVKNQLDATTVLEYLIREEKLLENIWVFESYFSELKCLILDYNSILIDYRLYTFVVKQIVENALIDGKAIQTEKDIEKLYSTLDKYNVEYYGKEELYAMIHSRKE